MNQFGVTESEIYDNDFWTCNNNSAIGKDGTIYGIKPFGATEESSKYGSELVAYKDGVHQWTHRFESGDASCSSMLYIEYILVGRNGNIYVGMNEGYPWCQNKSYLGAITAEGNELYVVALNANLIKWVGVYEDGIAITNYSSNLIRFYNFDGTLKNTVDLGLSPGESANTFVIDLEGNVYSSVVKRISSTNDCRTDYWSARVSIHSESGKSGEFTAFEDCTSIPGYVNFSSFTSGTWGAAFFVSDSKNNALQDSIIVIDKQGQQLNKFALDRYPQDINYDYSETEVMSDTNNNLVVKRTYHDSYPTSAKESRIELRDPISENHLGKIDTRYFNDDPDYGFSIQDLALGNNQIYFLGAECSNYGCDNANRNLLRSEHLEGLGMDYPRGALLQDSIPEPKINYVALGDSFSSGEGVEPFIPGTYDESNNCHRSYDAYPKLLARDDLLEQEFSLSAFRACSGAETTEMLNPSEENHEAAQIDYLNKSVDVVTLSIGGNDVGFADYALSCLTLGCDFYEDNISYQIDTELPSKLDITYQAISDKVSESTKVFVAGYPQLFPETNDVNPDCGFWERSVDMQSTRAVVSQLDAKIQDRVVAAGQQFEFVDPTLLNSPFIGHEHCTYQEVYFFGVVANPDTYNYSFHPNTLGQAAYKDLLKPKFEALIQ